MDTINRHTITINGESFANNSTLTSDSALAFGEISGIAAGVAGTAGEAGVMTMPEGHGFTDGQYVCVTWATGKHYNAILSSCGATSITVGSGDGDALPTSGAVVVALKTAITAAFSGTDVVALAVSSTAAALVSINDAGGVELALDLEANKSFIWTDEDGSTNPVTGDSIIVANAYATTTTAGTVKLGVALNNA